MAVEQETDNYESSKEGRREAPASWVGYSWYLVKKAGYGAYNGKHLLAPKLVSEPCLCLPVAHYLGGKLAHAFGVTSPDWQFAIDIHEDMEREAREQQLEEERALRHLQE